ncbi:MAG: calcium-binding protein [Planctomycetes bacterium]|nr:calcium-binding protein [Planctomycetota bacterium]
MRVLIAIPHFVRGESASRPQAKDCGIQRRHGSLDARVEHRVEALTACLASLRLHFHDAHVCIEQRTATARPTPAQGPVTVSVIVCTTGGQHALDRLPAEVRYFTHKNHDVEPELLGFTCHDVLRENLGQFDYYGFLEDDLTLVDPWFFQKLAWFNALAGDDKLLQPNRFEAGLGRLISKVYVDGALAERVTDMFQNIHDSPPLTLNALGQDVPFERTLNPHSGCFFLNARQMAHWVRQPHFNDRQSRFIGPLETTASLGIMRAFRVYKPAPACADFLEVQHHGTGYLDQLCAPEQENRP